MLIEKLIEFQWKGLGPLAVHVLLQYNWLISRQNKNL